MPYNDHDIMAALDATVGPVHVDPDPDKAYDVLHAAADGLFDRVSEAVEGVRGSEKTDVLVWLDRVLAVRAMLDEALQVQVLAWATLARHPGNPQAIEVIKTFEGLAKTTRFTLMGLDVAVSGARWQIEAERSRARE